MIGVTMNRINPAITSMMVDKVSPIDRSRILNYMLEDWY